MSKADLRRWSWTVGSFSRQITVIMSLVLAVAMLGSTIGFWSLFRVSVQTGRMVDEVMSAERFASNLQRHILVNVARSKALALSSEPQVEDALKPEIHQTSVQIDALLKNFDKILTASDDKTILSRMVQANDNFLQARQALTVARDGGVTANIERVYANQFRPAAQELQDAVTQLENAQQDKIEASVTNINQTSLTARWGLILFGICALLFGLVLSSWLVRGITVPIEQAVKTANQVAALDLTTHIEGQDRDAALRDALSQMQCAVHTLVHQVQGASDNVAQAPTQIASGKQDFSNRTEIAATRNTSLKAATRGKALAHNLDATSGSAIISEVILSMNDILLTLQGDQRHGSSNP